MLGLARRKALEKTSPTILKRVKDSSEEFRRISDRNLRHEGRSVTSQKRFSYCLLLDRLTLSGRAKGVHVTTTQHRRRVGILTTRI